MYSVEDMKTCIREWFADASDPVEVARTYSEIRMETETQLKFMMEQLTPEQQNLTFYKEGGRK